MSITSLRAILTRSVAVAAVAFGASALDSRPADAFVVECPTCSSIFEQILSDARQAQQYATQLSQLQNEIQMKTMMVTNLVRLPQQAWASVQNDIMQVRSIANAASVLAGNSGSMLQRLSTAQSYAGQAFSTPQQIGQQFSMYQQTLANAGLSMGRTLGIQQSQEVNATNLQAAIQAHSATAAGQLQAIQAETEMAGLTNYTLQQIQTTLTTQAQMIATAQIVKAERDGREDAAMMHFVAPPPSNLSFQRF